MSHSKPNIWGQSWFYCTKCPLFQPQHNTAETSGEGKKTVEQSSLYHQSDHWELHNTAETLGQCRETVKQSSLYHRSDRWELQTDFLLCDHQRRLKASAFVMRPSDHMSTTLASIAIGIILCMHVPSQWETTLQCNVVSHWLGAYTKSNWSLLLSNQATSIDGQDQIEGQTYGCPCINITPSASRFQGILSAIVNDVES